MNVQALQTLFTGLIMSKIAYALPSFAGQLTADDRNRIGAISRKAQRRGVLCTDFDIDDLIDTADCQLFSHITIPITVYTIYVHLEHTIPTTSVKDNMTISYLKLNTTCTKTVS